MPTIAKFSTKSSGVISSLKSTPDRSEKKRSLFQTPSKNNTDDESTSNGDKLRQSTTATVNSSMVATLAETPCKNNN